MKSFHLPEETLEEARQWAGDRHLSGRLLLLEEEDPDLEKRLLALGAELIEEVRLAPAPQDGVLPEGFYSTSNRPTSVYATGRLLRVEYLSMDCGIRVDQTGAQAKKMHQAKGGELFVIGEAGVLEESAKERKSQSGQEFGFMQSEVSAERANPILIERLARRMKELKEAGERILVVGGPAIVHAGAREHLAALIRAGYVNLLFAGNALAAHDLEAELFGTSLGISLADATPKARGNRNHLACINRIRGLGSIEEAVRQGVITGGIMYELVKNEVPYLLAGSIRDDGPLPGVITDSLKAQSAMKEALQGVKLAVMICTLLHSVATGNLLGAQVETFAIDISPSAVTKLKDRGSRQSVGLVMGAEAFLRELCQALEVS